MEREKWTEILSTVNAEKGLNKDNVIEKIGEKLQKEFPTVYEEWEEDNFNVDRLFGPGIFVIKQTLLHLAAENGHANIVNALLGKGANVNAIDVNGCTPLRLAAENGHANIVNALLAKDSNVNAIDVDGWTPLHSAALNGHLDIVNALLEKGADVNAVDSWFRLTPLHCAAENGHANIVNALLEKGADVNAVDSWFRLTPLHSAALNGHLEIVNALLAKDSNVNAIDVDGWTPLHSAAECGHTDLAKALLAKGANPLLKNNNGQTPIDLAKNDSIKQLLEEAEVRQLSQQQATTKGIIAGSATAALGTAIAAYLFVNGIIAVEAMSIALAVVAIAAVALAVGGVTYKALQPSSKVDGTQVPENKKREKDAAQLP